MKLLIAMAILSSVVLNVSTYAQRTKSIPIEDQGPGKGEKDSKKEKNGKKKNVFSRY